MLKKLSNLEGIIVLKKQQQKDVNGGDDNAHVMAYCQHMYPLYLDDYMLGTMTINNVPDHMNCVKNAYSF